MSDFHSEISMLILQIKGKFTLETILEVLGISIHSKLVLDIKEELEFLNDHDLIGSTSLYYFSI